MKTELTFASLSKRHFCRNTFSLFVYHHTAAILYMMYIIIGHPCVYDVYSHTGVLLCMMYIIIGHPCVYDVYSHTGVLLCMMYIIIQTR